MHKSRPSSLVCEAQVETSFSAFLFLWPLQSTSLSLNSKYSCRMSVIRRSEKSVVTLLCDSIFTQSKLCFCLL
ncbi:hypothetical protein Scep_016958 [Stephania cephalantha]|uniref:Uncharacterized protein n=1 Tax=Stephania cephalantha TaxID=152367 RepID=A0AAP0IP64_9MAGN